MLGWHAVKLKNSLFFGLPKRLSMRLPRAEKCKI